MEHVAMERARIKKQKQLSVDERLIMPEQRAELVRGELIMTPPAGEPHARKHAELGALLQAHVAPGYLAALDMLTRMSETSDFAPDASIYPEARDAEGHRQLEVMAFEIVSRQRRSIATSKAQEMATRGVKRIFCIDLNTSELLEWTGQTWTALGEDETMEDVCLSRPLSIKAILHSASGDDAVAQALHSRGNAYIEQLVQHSHGAGRAEGELSGRQAELRRSIVRIVERVAELPEALRVRLEACDDLERLDQCMEIALSSSSEDVLDALSYHLASV